MSDDYDEENDPHRQAQDAYNEELDAIIEDYPKDKARDLNDALYMMSERYFFGLDSMDPETALRIWAVVERVRTEGFPEDLGM